jgi:hypothetical protein
MSQRTGWAVIIRTNTPIGEEFDKELVDGHLYINRAVGRWGNHSVSANVVRHHPKCKCFANPAEFDAIEGGAF